jgi:shikimate dehydrogenase
VSGAVALIGDPVRHSPSPTMHRAAFAALGLDVDYEAIRVHREALPDVFPSLARRFLGLNVTRPLKEAVLPLLDEVSPEASRAGSVNTVSFREDRAEGTSTDGAGFLAALRHAGVPTPSRAMILGTGGAARAVGAALIEGGTSVTVSGRNADAGHRLVADLGPGPARFVPPTGLAEAVAGAELLVNATPVGGWPETADSPLPGDVPLPAEVAVFDLVYRPRPTALLARARTAGCLTIEGVEMLVEQGAASLRVWTGLEPPVDVMRAAALRALEREPQAAGTGGDR